jgi:hypothetical protein
MGLVIVGHGDDYQGYIFTIGCSMMEISEEFNHH